MGQRSIRFPDGLEARIVARAEEADRSFSYVVVKALEKALGAGEGSPQDSVGAGRATRETDRRSRSASSRAPVEKELGAEEHGAPRATPAPPRRALSAAMVRQQALNKAKEKT